MRAVIQRVQRARVTVDGTAVGEIGKGLLVLLGVGEGDQENDLLWTVRKVAELRIMDDEAGKMNLSVEDAGGSVLLVSQFTLYADTSRGRRPSFTQAMAPAAAEAMVLRAVASLRARGLTVETGRFGAMMQVELVNDGPVTISIDSRTP